MRDARGWPAIRRALRLPSTRRRMREELDAELRFHLEGRIEDLMEREHLSRDEASREARRRFGDVGIYRREASDIDETMLQRRRSMELTEAMGRETRHAVRTLLRAPSFSSITILTLALGLGAATTIFTLLDRVVLRPLPYPNADRLVHLGTLWPKVKAGDEYGLAKGQYFNFKRNSASIADIAMYDADMNVISGDGDHATERVPFVNVSRSTFDLLGIKPERGQLFGADEERSRDATVALITHGYWQRRFGGDENIVGKRLQLGGGRSLEIIGVLPPSASLPDWKADVWTRNLLDPNEPPQNNHSHLAIALLKPGVTVDAAAADIKRLQNQFAETYPDVYSKDFVARTGFAMNVTSLRDAIVGKTIIRALWLLFGAVGFVLLIAAANVANLFLVRMDARRREAAVRTALGADRAHLAVHYLAESLLLTIVAGAAAVALGDGLLHVVLAIAPQSLPRLNEVSFDWRSISFCLGAAISFGVVFGLLPVSSTAVDIAMIRDGGRGLTTSRSRDVARRGLVLSQVALAVVLLSGAALMTKSFARLRNVQPGFEPVGVVSMTLSLPSGRYGTYQQVAAFWHELSTKVEAMPGVMRAGATDNLPLASEYGCSGVITDAIAENGEGGNCMPFVRVTPGFFETMGIKVAGEAPTWSSVESGAGPVVVSRGFAKRFWRDASPIGHGVKPYRETMPSFPIVGIAGDVRGTGLQEPAVEAVYFPLVPPTGADWGTPRSMSFVVRAPGVNQGTLITAIRQVLAGMDSQVPIANVQSMESVVAKSMAQTSFTMLLLLIAAVIALALSAVGIYGVISYVVGQRRGEIGIRMALGAQVGEVSRLIIGQSLTLAGVGVAVGLVGSLAGMRLLQSLLFEVSPTDPVILGGAAVVLLAVATVASLGPTRRAARIDPVEAMRGS